MPRCERSGIDARTLGSSGQIIRRSRGSTAEQLEAGKTRSESASSARPPASAKARKAEPRPSRRTLDEAEAAVLAVERAHADQIEAIARQEGEVAANQRRLEKMQYAELGKVVKVRDRAVAAYHKAITRWRG